MKKILVTGGCGYIGSHTLIDLLENGYQPVALDSNVRSNPAVLRAVERITGHSVALEQVDITDAPALRAAFARHANAVGVVHFAAFKSVPESVKAPLLYYQNNVTGLINVLEAVREQGIGTFIFSSSCAVYGNTNQLPVTEATPIGEAQSPYAHTKQIGEQMIERIARAHSDQNFLLLRYFNPGGAHPSGWLGELPQKNAYNVIPILLECLEGQRPTFSVTGTDHPTADGSCVRDYIHVLDVAHAHTKALDYLLEGRNERNCEAFNIGIGQGVSVLELIEAFDRATGRRLPYTIGPRRAGDVSAIYADASKANERLQWQPRYTIDDLLATSWRWYQNDYQLP